MTNPILYLVNDDDIELIVKKLLAKLEPTTVGTTLTIDDVRVPVMSSTEVKEALDISDTTLWRYEQLPDDAPKHLTAIKYKGRKYYRRSDIETILIYEKEE